MTKKILFITLVIISLSFQKHKKNYINYHLQVAEAKLSFLQRDYDKCIQLLNKANIEAPFYCDNNRNDLFLLSKAYYKKNNIIKFKQYFKIANKKGLSLRLLKQDSSFFKNEIYQKLVEENKREYKQFNEKLRNKKLIKKIEAGLEQDQKYRLQLGLNTIDNEWLAPFDTISDDNYFTYYINVINNAPKASKKEIDSLRTLQKNIDDINFNYFSTYIKENGYPTYNEIGESQGKLFGIILHFPNDFKKNIISYWTNNIKLGNIAPYNLARLVDKAMFDSGEKPLYGTIEEYFNIEENKMIKYDYNFSKVDSLRRIIGIPSLKIERQIKELEKK